MKSLKQRFLEKCVENFDTGCWNWIAARVAPARYGQICVGGRMRLAHRVSFEIHCGPIPDEMHVLHRCDNPACVNPDHLFLGDPASNVKDMIDKGRRASTRGERNGSAKITSSEALAIRISKDTQRACAMKFGVSQRLVRDIRSGKLWGHVNQNQEDAHGDDRRQQPA